MRRARYRRRSGAAITGLVATVLMLALAAPASALWSSRGSGTGVGAALSMPAGSTPSVVVSGGNVVVRWSPATFSTGVSVAGYVVHRYDASTGAAAVVGTGCSGTVTTTTCTEDNVPAGTWTYTDAPVQQNWTGTESAASGSVTIQASSSPVNTALPQISGTPREGQTLSATPGAWNGTPSPSFDYQWQRCDAGGDSCVDVGGDSAEYLLGAGDVDSTLRVSVKATNTVGSSAATSKLTEVIGLAHDPTIVAVGDIACPAGDTTDACQQQETATLASNQNPDDVLVLGDNQYNSGLYSEYEGTGAYNATWGVFNPIVHPVPGNHEYTASSTAAGYFQYFGTLAGTAPGYYSFNLGTWHIDALNSDCTDSGCQDSIGGDTSSAQNSWLQSDLASDRSACTLAFWHHPRFSSGFVGDSPNVGPLWTALYNAHADVVVNGHDHVYERYAQQDPSGNATSGGIREFVAGTGGEKLFTISKAEPNVQASDQSDFGVLIMTLHPTSYDWAFKRTDGTVVDSGTTSCHGPGSGSASASLVRASAAREAAASQPQLGFDARPLHTGLNVVARQGLPVAVRCSRACDVTVTTLVRRGTRLERIASSLETESEIPRPRSWIFLRLPARSLLTGSGSLTLVLRFSAVDAAGHHRVLTRTVTLPGG